jgi:hypothetical protein
MITGRVAARRQSVMPTFVELPETAAAATAVTSWTLPCAAQLALFVATLLAGLTCRTVYWLTDRRTLPSFRKRSE